MSRAPLAAATTVAVPPVTFPILRRLSSQPALRDECGVADEAIGILFCCTERVLGRSITDEPERVSGLGTRHRVGVLRQHHDERGHCIAGSHGANGSGRMAANEGRALVAEQA